MKWQKKRGNHQRCFDKRLRVWYLIFHSLLTFISKTKICEPKTDVHKFTNQKTKKFQTKNANKIPPKKRVWTDNKSQRKIPCAVDFDWRLFVLISAVLLLVFPLQNASSPFRSHFHPYKNRPTVLYVYHLYTLHT